MKTSHLAPTLLIIVTLLFGLTSMSAPVLAQSSKPNIVLIFADDLGWKDVGFNGNDFHETPNIDRLAGDGIVFSNAYAAAGNCAPSRACMISGTYTPRHHVYAVGSTDRGPKQSQRLIPIPNRSGLAQDNITLADALKTAGYATGIFGKWHLSGPEGVEPSKQGFDVVFDSQRGDPNLKRDRAEDPKGIFSIVREASSFMAECKQESRPFFAYIPHHAIHSALEARPESLKKFENKPKGLQHQNPLYAACTYDLDASVGILLDKIRELGIENNTLLIFTSDNGGTQQSSQEPLRGNKGGYYEGGIREPFIAHWPGVIKPGSKSNAPIINVDLYPTFLAAAGVNLPEGKTLDGENLLPLMQGTGQLKRSALFWHFPGYLDGPVIRGRESDVKLGFRTRPISVIRKGDWKLHLFHEEWQLDGGRELLATNGAVELYNIATDIGERNNVALSNIPQRDELLGELLSWIDRTHALIPSEKNPEYSSIAGNAPKAKKGKGKGNKKKKQL